MNRNLYRIVFNKARGLLMVVAEIAPSHGGGDASSTGAYGSRAKIGYARLRLVSFAAKVMAGALAIAMPLAHAQIVADRKAPSSQQATILKTANGTTQVNIRTPSAAGVSRNTYSQFDVNKSGVVLNNARTAAQTQIGGWVQGNPWLAKGSARVILNEVNSSNPSQLRGYVEIAGSKAQLVIANPSGVTCDGCGFINADRTTLTTGKPIVNGGSLDGYLVRQGTVTITGGGMDASRSTYTDIISRAVEINAGIWANELRVTAGANQVNAANTQATTVAGNGSTPQPAFAIDVAQLGGMYANKIALIGTEAGLGVRNAGQIGASAGSVVVTADGRLENSGQIASGAGTTLTAGGDIVNTGSVYAGGNLDVRSGGNIGNDGTVAAGGNANLAATGNASRIVNADGAIIGSGIGSDGSVGTTGDLTITATNDISLRGQSIAGGDQTIRGTTLDLKDSRIAGRNLGIYASLGDIDLSHANAQASKNLDATAVGSIDNTGGLLAANAVLTATAATIINDNTSDVGLGIQGGTVHVTADSISNRHGAILADDAITLDGKSQIDNTQGTISAVGSIGLADAGAQAGNAKMLAVTNTAGAITAGNGLTIDSRDLSGDGQLLSGGDLVVRLAGDYVNTGELQANGKAVMETDGNVVNHGRIAAGDELALAAANIDNSVTGEISADNLAISANGLTNRGLIDGHETVIEADAVNNIGTGRIYGDHVAIAANTILNDTETVGSTTTAATIASRDRLDLGASQITNREHASIVSMGDMHIGGQLDEEKHAAGKAVLLSNNSATIESQGSLDIAAESIRNTNEHFATQMAVISKSSFSQYQGAGSSKRYDPNQIRTYTDESLHLSTPDGNYESWSRYDVNRTVTETQITQSDPGVISSAGGMNIDADIVLNDKSTIMAGGDITGNIDTLTNTTVSGEHRVTDSGSVTSYWRHRKKGRDSTSSSTAAYKPAPTVTAISLTPTIFRENAAPTGSSTTIAGRVGNSFSQTVRGADDSTIMTGIVNTSVPDGSMFSRPPNPSASYLIETDPRFASYRTWLSSDYMLQQLSLDPTVMQKRLGDGFYEQKLVREQVAQLTGRRFLDSYASDEEQYRALIDNGVTVATQMNLIPGVALTAAQMAALTTDIVWLVERDVTLPDGQVTKALVPQVYVRVQDGDLSPSGALIAGNNVNLNLGGDLVNSGTIAGRNIVALNADNIQNLGGRIVSGDTVVQARTDINNIGGTIEGRDSVTAIAGRDLNMSSTTHSQSTSQGSRTNIDRVAALYASKPGATLVASAGRDINLGAAQIINSGEDGVTKLVAGNDLNLSTVTESRKQTIVWDGNNFRRDGDSQEVGTIVNTQGDVQLLAGHNLNARAANVTTAGGALAAIAGNDVNITAGTSTVNVDEAHKHKSKSGWFSSKTVTTRDTLNATTSEASTFSGETVSVQADRDINIKGSNVVSTTATTLMANNNVNIEAATDTKNENHFRKVKKSGLFGSGGFGFTIGSQEQSTQGDNTDKMAAASTVGSTQGNVSIYAGTNYRQVGSHVAAPQGDVAILASKVDIVEAQNTSVAVQETKFKQSGLTVAVTSPVITAIQTAQQMSEAAKDTKDARMQVLAGATTALSINNAADAIQRGQGITTPDGKTNQIATGNKLPDGSPEYRDANAADKAGGINISISIGGSKSESKTTQTSSTAAGSTVVAGNDVNIVATGAGSNSDITIQGSDVNAGRNIVLSAEDEVRLLAAKNTADQHSNNKNSSGSVGISFGTDGLLFTAGASAGHGKADGSDVSWSNTHVTAGNQVAMQSGGDTTLKGAVVNGKQVVADVGGNLQIASLQDTSKYDSKQQSMGGSISVGYGRMGGSISASKSKIDSDYASVTETSGIKAGDDGFQVNVQGNTDLKGAVIASTDAAVQDGKNSFQTASLTTSDIQNSASYEASSAGISVGSSVNFDGKVTPSGNSIGYGSDSGNASSVTESGVSGIAGNKDVRTDDKESGIAKIFDADRVQREIDAQVKITQAFGREAPKAAANFAASQMQSLKEQAKAAMQAGDESKAAQLLAEAGKWDEGGAYRIALHTALGGLAGGIDGALGAGAVASAAPLLNQLQDGVLAALKDAGIGDTVAQAAAQLIAQGTAAGVGAAVSGGSVAGAGMAFNIDTNNRQLHPKEIDWIKANAARYAKQKGISVEMAEQELAEQAFRQVQFGAEGDYQAWDMQAAAFLKQAGSQLLPGDPNVPGQNVGYMFYATPEQRANANMYLASTVAYADFYKENGLQQPTPEQLTQAAQRNAEILSKASTATKLALGASASIALGGLSPTLLQWALSNPLAATEAGIISAETAAAIVSGAVTPSGLLQKVANPEAARVVYSKLATAAMQNATSGEVVLGRYIAGSVQSYEQIAQARGAAYYEVSAWNAIEKELGSQKMWEINKAFLDNSIAEGKSFVFTSNPALVVEDAPLSSTANEVRYLLSKGFVFKKEGEIYRAFK